MAQEISPCTEITIFLSSPSDVKDEREMVKHVVQEINEDPARQGRCKLTLLAHEKCVPPQMGKSPQRVVDDFMRLSSKSDIVVCIFCNRMGTPTVDEKTGQSYLSGTYYEFDTAYRAFKESGEVAPRIMLFLGYRSLSGKPSNDELEQFSKVREFKEQIEKQEIYQGLYSPYEHHELLKLETVIRSGILKHLDSILTRKSALTDQPALAIQTPRLRAYLEQLAENYKWLELQGIKEAGTLRIELEKVYIALKAEPESDFERQQAANLHSIEICEEAGVDSVDTIDPKKLEELEGENLRRTYRTGKAGAKREAVNEVRSIGDVFRQYRQIVILGGPGSGKTTLGRWMALQLARGFLRQLEIEVAPEDYPTAPNDRRVIGSVNTQLAFHAKQFSSAGNTSDEIKTICLLSLPSRGSLRLTGLAVTEGQNIDFKQITLLTYFPGFNECGSRYTHFRFATGNGETFGNPVTMVIDILAQTLVPASQINPDFDTGSDQDTLVNLGPARLPIFLRLAHFARELAERERATPPRPTLSLIDYLGHDSDSCGLADGYTPENRNALFHSYIGKGQAFIILDGLDELSETNRRLVVMKVQDLIKGKEFTKGHQDKDGLPWEVGGNQIVVTSRYVGYKLAPVRAECAHFGIQAMQRPAVERFAHAWAKAVNVELAAEKLQQIIAENLIAEIYNEARPAVCDLATNPLLVTILATVYWAEGRLPDQRAGVYDCVVENLIRIWLKREECRINQLKREELLAALEPLAAEMQENANGNGFIDLARIGELVKEPLAHLRGMDERRFALVREALLITIRKHVGLLAEQSPGNYAFFHRTFQEFLAARHLLADRKLASKKIIEKLDDPLWREPLLLALGFAMITPEWGPNERKHLLTEVLDSDGTEALFPRAALLLVNALPDLREAPADVVGRTASQLLISYAISQEHTQAGALREQIEQAFKWLRDSFRADTVAHQIADMVRRQPNGGRDLACAAAAILRQIDWFTTEIVEALLQAILRDKAVLDWPVHRALLAAFGQRPAQLPSLRSAPNLRMDRILNTCLPMRRLLESNPDLLAWVHRDPDWLWLLIALYGGLGQTHLIEKLEHYQQQCLQATKATLGLEQAEEPVTADPPPQISAVGFSPHDIVHDLVDTELSRIIQHCLGERRAARELIDTFQQRWIQNNNPAGSAEALIGLAALGEDILPMLTQPDHEAATRIALAQFGWLRSLLQEPLVRATEAAARTIPETASEQQQLDLLRIALEARVDSGGFPLLISDKMPEYRFINAMTPEICNALDAEYWACIFSGMTNVNYSEALNDLIFEPNTDSIGGLIHAWSLLANARNSQAAQRLAWPQEILAPRADTPVEQYLAMLDSMATAPKEYYYVTGYVLGRCRPFLNSHPDLIWETLAMCRGHGDSFSTGYFSAAVGAVANGRPFTSLWAQNLPAYLTRGLNQLIENWDTNTFIGLLAQIFQHQMETNLVGDLPAEDSNSTLAIGISRVTDPYLRFRARWRMFAANLDKEEALELEVDAKILVGKIINPHDWVRAFEWGLMGALPANIDLMTDIGLFAPIMRMASLISDPENRARAQCRLALLIPAHMEELLREAVTSVSNITDINRKSETITDIRTAWGRMTGMPKIFDTLAQTIPDVWQRHKALGRNSRLIQAYRNHFSTHALVWRIAAKHKGVRTYRCPYPTGILPWGVLFLNAVATEAESLGTVPTGGNAQWDRLLGAERQAGVASLMEAALEDGLTVTTRQISILDRLLQSGHGTDLEPLWPFLGQPAPGTLGMIKRWLPRQDRSSQWVALVQAEEGHLTAEVVKSVISLLRDSTDRLYLRATLALHGPTPNTQNKRRRWSVRRTGVEAITALAHQATQLDNSPAVRSVLWWVHHDMHHDDPAAIKHWLVQAQATNSETDKTAAYWILDSIESAQADIIPLLLEAIPSAPSRLQRALLKSLARLAYCSNIPKGDVSAVLAVVATVPPEIRMGLFSLPKGPVTILEVIRTAVEISGEQDCLDQAQRLLEQKILWLDDLCLKNNDGLQRLKAIGNQLYINIGTYWSETDKAAVPLAENLLALRLLLRWLENKQGNQRVDHILPELLTATEAISRLSPSAFAVVADPDRWEPALTEWARFGERWTTRMAAIRMLGRLRRVTDRVVRALKAAMNDVSFTQQAAYESVTEFRRIEGDILTDILRLLEDPSAAVVAATARLLVAVANAEGTSADRRQILHSLQEAATRSSMVRPVYLMDEGTWMKIRFVDRLDRILYRAIFEISGL